MKQLSTYIQEKLIINKDYRDTKIAEPKTFDELRQIIVDRYYKLGPGTKQKPIDFNDIDTSNITSFDGLFKHLKFKYIDISLWDTIQVESMEQMFYDCNKLISIGNIGKWNVHNVESFSIMFSNCICLENIGDLSSWDVSNVKIFKGMFFNCNVLESIGDLTDWKVTDKLKDTFGMFDSCYKLKNIGDIGKWEMKNVSTMCSMFSMCKELEYIGDISSWDLRSVVSMSSIFRGCYKLTNIGNLSKWKKPKGLSYSNCSHAFLGSSIKNTPKWMLK